MTLGWTWCSDLPAPEVPYKFKMSLVLIWLTMLVGSADADSSNYDDMIAEVAELKAVVSTLTETVRGLQSEVAEITARKTQSD